MSDRQPSFFFGWIVLIGLFGIMTLGSGFAFYSQGVFLDALVREQGFSSGMAGAGTGVYFAASGLGGYYTGGLINRFDVRWVMTVGAIAGGGGLALLGQIRAPWQMFAVMIIFGAGYSLVGLVPCTTMIGRWFNRRRVIAMSIASTGLSLGGATVSPYIGRLIDQVSLEFWAPQIGFWFVAANLPLIWLALRPWPHSIGQRPDGDPADPTVTTEPGGAMATAPGVPFDEARRSRYFKVMSIGFILVMGAQVGAIQHAFSLVRVRTDVATAVFILTLLPVISVVFRIVGGIVASKVGLSSLTRVLIGVQVFGIAILAVAETRLLFAIGVVILGSAMGNLLMLHPLLLTEAFGIRDYGRIYGLGSLLMIIGVAGGPLLVGVVKDLTDYRVAFITITVVAALGGLIFMAAGSPPAPTPPRSEGPDDHSTRNGQVNGHSIDLRPATAPQVFDVAPAPV